MTRGARAAFKAIWVWSLLITAVAWSKVRAYSRARRTMCRKDGDYSAAPRSLKFLSSSHEQ